MEQKSRALLLWSRGLAYKILGEQSYRFRQRARSDAEGPFDDACFATDAPRLKIAACLLRKARMTSKPLSVA